MLDAYSIRKAAPRLLVAVIGINLSIYLCVGAIDLTNIVGRGLMDLLTSPFVNAGTYEAIGVESNAENNTIGILGGAAVMGGAIFAIVGSIGAVGASIIAVLGMLLPLIITVSLIALAVLFTLVIRTALLIFLTIVSPVAIACFVLPGTEKYFQKWMDLFGRTLMVYPIIAAIFAMSNVMAAILLNNASAGAGSIFGPSISVFGQAAPTSDAISTIQILAAILVLYAPLVLIPFAFKLAGGAISAVMNAASGRAGNIAGRVGKRVQESRNDPTTFLGKGRKRAQDTRYERGLTGGQVMSGLMHARHGLKPGSGGVKSAYSSGSKARRTEYSMQRLEEMMKHPTMAPVINNDDFLQAGRKYTDAEDMKKYLVSKGYGAEAGGGADQGVAAVMRAKGIAGNQIFKQVAAVRLPATGTANKVDEAYEEDRGIAGMNRALWDAAGGDQVLFGNLMAQARQGAQEGNRTDLQPGFATHIGTALQQVEGVRDASGNIQKDAAGNAIKLTDSEVQQKLTDNVLFTKGPGYLLSARGDTMRAMMPAFHRRIDNARQEVVAARTSGDPDRVAKAERSMKQVFASNAALLDVATQVAPENAQILAGYTDPKGVYHEGVMDHKFKDFDNPGLETEVSTMIEAMRDDEEFGQMRREYRNQATAQHNSASADAAAAAVAAGGAPKSPIPPTGTI